MRFLSALRLFFCRKCGGTTLRRPRALVDMRGFRYNQGNASLIDSLWLPTMYNQGNALRIMRSGEKEQRYEL